jgi:hypothetical protein
LLAPTIYSVRKGLPQEETISEFSSGQLSDMSDIDTEIVDSNVPTTNLYESSQSVGMVYGELSSIDTSVCETGELYDTLISCFHHASLLLVTLLTD